MKILTDELALQLTKNLLQNDKSIKDDLQSQIDSISATSGSSSPTITIARTEADDGVIITVVDSNGTNSIVVYDGEAGANGKNVQVAKTEPIVGGNKITFSYYDENNIQQSSSLEIMNGEKGVSVSDARIENGNNLILSLSDGSEIDAGIISVDSSGLSLDNYYTKTEIDEKFETQRLSLEELIKKQLDESIGTISSDEIENLF